MTPDELQAACLEAIEHQGLDAEVLLVLPRQARGDRMRLTPQGGPLGEVVNGDQRSSVAYFPAQAVLAWMERQGIGKEDAHASAE